MKRRLLSLLSSFVLLIALLPQLTMPALAAYENTYKNTGDQRKDIVGVALTQVGYLEGNGKDNNNDNKYSKYFGYGARSWCGDFVSWCARQAGIPKSIIKTNGQAIPSKFGITTTYKGSSGYTPLAGDLFFKGDDHVGIVYYTDGKYFYTIEGNTWPDNGDPHGVYIRKRLIADYTYGVPKYENNAPSTNCDHNYETKNESEHPHKQYKLCTKCAYKTYTGKNVSVDSCKTCAQESCSHTYSQWEKSSSTKHKRICSICGKAESGNHKWSTAETVTEATCSTSGSKKQTCTLCAAEKTTTINATGKHVYEGITYIDEQYHGKICTQCGKGDKAKHVAEKEWFSDGKNHWNFCKDCGERINIGLHDYETGCGSACKICAYISPFTHELSETYTVDKAMHYRTCMHCTFPMESGEHEYSSECDETCNICQAIRTTSIEHTQCSTADPECHWIVCSMCQQEQTHIPHQPDETALDWEDQCCTDCGYVLRSKDEHVHKYDTIDYDRRTHWGTCACGTLIEAEGHRFSMETGKCTVCLAASTPIGAQYDYDLVWLAGLAAFALIVLVMLLVLMFRNIFRKRI